jgi:hypothetical protein
VAFVFCCLGWAGLCSVLLTGVQGRDLQKVGVANQAEGQVLGEVFDGLGNGHVAD